VSTSPKPDPARGWQFVEKLLAKDDANDDEVPDPEGDAEVDRLMRAAGVSTPPVPSAEELTARAAERAALRTRPLASGNGNGNATVRALPVRRRTHWSVWLVAAAIASLAAVVIARRSDVEGQPSPDALRAVTELRRQALRDCEAHEWKRCLTGLDEARARDPRGDAAPDVREARERAEKALR
jgi:hypothetical protein